MIWQRRSLSILLFVDKDIYCISPLTLLRVPVSHLKKKIHLKIGWIVSPIIACIDLLGEKVQREGSYWGTLSWLPKGKDLGVPKVLEGAKRQLLSWWGTKGASLLQNRERDRERGRRSNIIYWIGNHQKVFLKTNTFGLMGSYIWETSRSNWLEFSIKLMEGVLENESKGWSGGQIWKWEIFLIPRRLCLSGVFRSALNQNDFLSRKCSLRGFYLETWR